ncbi:MAG: hypothetical protein WC373_12125 [Smithella sp.]|jgi:hypothetical protein
MNDRIKEIQNELIQCGLALERKDNEIASLRADIVSMKEHALAAPRCRCGAPLIETGNNNGRFVCSYIRGVEDARGERR